MLAWVYSRRSRALGDPDDPSLMAAHLSALARLAASDGVAVDPANIRTEVGSGERIADRPVFAALVDEWQRLPPGAGGILYCTEPARLSRGDEAESGELLRLFTRADIKVRTPGQSFDFNRPEDRFRYSLASAVSHLELNLNKQRVALKRAEMTAAGQVITGKVPFGYRWVKSPGQQSGQRVPGYPEPDKEQWPILLALIRDIFSEGVETLARRYGLSPTTVRSTLRSPMICGYPARRHASHQGTKPWKQPYHLLPREVWTWPERPGEYEAACTREQWEAIQQVLAARYTRRGRTGAPRESGWATSAVAFAGFPGRVRLSAVSVHGRSIPTYERPRQGAPHLYVARAPVHAEARRALSQLSRQPELLAYCLQVERARQARLPPAAPDTEALARRLERERGRLVNLQTQAADPEARPAALQGLRQAVNACVEEIESLEAALSALQEAPAARPDLAVLTENLPLLTAEDFNEEWEEATGTEKAALVGTCLAALPVEVEVLPGKRARRRDVLPAVYAPWLVPFFCSEKGVSS